MLKNRQKFNILDDLVFVSAQIPGPGDHNPYVTIEYYLEITSENKGEHDGIKIMEEKTLK